MAEHHEDADIELAGPRLRLLACAQENDVAGVARILQQHPELRDARSDKGVTAVHEAAQRGSLAVLALLRDCGARLNIPNVEWMTPLMVALLHGQGAAVSLLLEACPAAVAGRNGAAVLGLCVQLGLPEPFLRQLHAAGAQPDAVGRWGGTPLHMAAERGSAAAVRQLLKLKERVDVDVPDCEGWTPLHLAAGLADKRACSAIVATLLHAGANPEARTANGHRPLDVSRAGDTAAVALLERKTAAQPASAILSPVARTAAEAAEQPAGAVPLALVSSPQLGPPTPAKVPKAAAIEAAAAGDGEDMPAAAPALPPCLTVSAPVLAAGSAICGSGSSSSSSADDAPAAVVATAEMAAEAAPPLPSTPAVSTGSAGSGSSSSNSQPQQQGPLTVAVGQQHGLSAAESARLKAEAAMAELVEEEERENQWKAQQQQKQQDAKKNAAQRKAEQQAANAAAKAKLMAEAEAAGVAEAQAAELAKSEAARRRQEGEEQRMQQGYESLLAASQAAEETEQQAAAAAAAAAAELNADQQPADGQQAEAAAPAAAQPPAAQHAQQGKPRWQPKAASPQPELMPEQRPAISAVEQPRQQQQPWHSPPSAAGWGAAQQAPAVLPAAVLVQAQQGSWPTATEQQEDAAAIQASMASAGTAAAQQQAGPWQLVGGHCGERLEQPAAEAVAEARGKVPQGLGILAAEQPSASPHVPPPPAAAALAELEDELLRRAIEASLDRSQDVVPSQVRQDAARAAAAAAGGSSSGTAGAAVPDGMGGFTALRNEAGEYNCFLNVLVQCLWHCPEFRQQVSQWGPQIRAARPIASALHSLFEEFKAQQESGGEVSSSPGAAGAAGAAAGSPAGRSAPASPARPAPPFAGSSAPPSPPNAWQPGHKPAWLLAAAAAANGGATLAPVDPAPLREVLAQLPGCKFAQGEMHDASEVLLAIYEAVMEAERQVSAAAAAEGGTAIEKIFGLKVQEEVHCSACKKASHQNNYTQYFCMAQGITLRTLCGVALTMGSLLREAADQDVKRCDTDLGGCGRPNSVNHFLQRAPRVFTLHLCWTTHNEEPADIAATLAAVDETVDLGEVYRGVDRGVHRYTLRSMVCYYGKHYQALVWSPGAASEAKGESGAWLMFDDARVSRVGSWADVRRKCEAGRIQPSVLFYERA